MVEVPAVGGSHLFSKREGPVIRCKDKRFVQMQCSDICTYIPGKGDVLCRDGKVLQDLFLVDIDGNNIRYSPAESLCNGPGTDRFTLPEPLILTCIGHVGENEPVYRIVTRIHQQQQLDKCVVAHDTPDDNGLVIQISCHEVLLAIRKTGELDIYNGSPEYLRKVGGKNLGIFCTDYFHAIDPESGICAVCLSNIVWDDRYCSFFALNVCLGRV